MEIGELNTTRVQGQNGVNAEEAHIPTPFSGTKVAEKHAVDDTIQQEEEDVPSNLYPFPELPGAVDEGTALTIRAILIGCCLGAVVSASNIYLGLKTGWTFGASLFGSILGFCILKPLSRISSPYLGGGYFGPKENLTVQTAATASGGLGIIFVGAVPAMYQMGLLSADPKNDIGKLITFSACTAYYGLFFAIALRKFYILKLKLIFPSPTAVAYVIRALHAGGAEAEANAKLQGRSLAISFTGAALWRVISQYAPGITWDFHPAWWIASTTSAKSLMAVESWSWYFELTPAFIGAGILSGVNASLSFFGGSVFAWGIIGPCIVKYQYAFGKPIGGDEYPLWVNYNSLSLKDPINKPSPRYWMLWPGVFIMLCASFAEVAMHGPVLFRGLKNAFWDSLAAVPQTRAFSEKHTEGQIREVSDDPRPKSEQVPWWAWSGGVILAVVFSCIVLALQYDVSPGITILSVILAFIFSFIAAQSSGATDINPVSTCAKASQLVLGGVTQGQGLHGFKAETINMIGGIVSGGAAAQSVDMLGDLRTGYLLSGSPLTQFIAQVFGSLCSVFLCCGFFILFSTAYPCIINVELADTCSFAAPSVAAWRAVALAVTATQFPVPKGSGICALVIGIFAVGLTVAKYTVIPERRRHLVPNMNAVGLAFTLPQTYYSTAMAVGAIASYIWLKRSAKTWNIYAYSIAAGLAAGEGIGGVVNALFQVIGIAGEEGRATSVGCPGNEYCG
ncbi:oligopeptide transporter [Protomyces lactucae-debilis]|uniref:Oligopeptide transporter n=1 Tax=Protomyces lactucae-debilis TaxID=2754530 RepID=A0A1Y2FET8_PROLT|nr:oligopeptide transporter [Protomyces lactucae-debilis]ORY82431.1 oligopeptide transporter [Protomyces lactucae-debilis]